MAVECYSAEQEAKAEVFSPYLEATGAIGSGQEGEGGISDWCGNGSHSRVWRMHCRQDCRQQRSAQRLLHHRTPERMVSRTEYRQMLHKSTTERCIASRTR